MQPEQEWPNKKLNLKFLKELDIQTPTLIMDLDNIKKQYSRLAKSLPQAKIHYAVKCNPEKEILELLKSAGGQFEIASKGELERLKAIGVDPKDAIFSNPMKIPEHIYETAQNGLYRFAVDSPGELKKIALNAPHAEVYIRVQVSNHGSVVPLSSKFGAHPSMVLDLAELAVDLGLTPIGLAFHVGSQAETIQLWDHAFEVIGPLYAEAKNRGLNFSILNIGGGFPTYYAARVPQIEQIADSIKINLKKHSLENVALWVEPGRYLVAEAGVLASTIIGRESRGNHEWIYLDVGRFNGLAELFESDDLRYPVITSKDDMANSASLRKEMTLTGPSCDAFDTIFHNVPINAAVAVGDRVYFGTAGAYTHVYASTFNDFLIPKVIFC